jgi:hypothetical protein
LRAASAIKSLKSAADLIEESSQVITAPIAIAQKPAKNALQEMPPRPSSVMNGASSFARK